jgi:hypothetical protein
VVVDGADRLKDGAKVLARQGGAARQGAGAAAGAGSDARTPAAGEPRRGSRPNSQPGGTGGS